MLDVDGVICDFLTPALDAIERLTGRRPPDDRYQILDGYTDYEKADCWAAMNAPGFCAGLNPYEGARAFVDALRSLGRVVFATAPMKGPTWEGERRRWLLDHMGAAWGDVASVADKSLVGGVAILEDSPGHMRAWAEAHPEGLAMLWHAPYNAGDLALPHGERAHDYNEAFDLVARHIEALERGDGR